jgi:hypothetical protein
VKNLLIISFIFFLICPSIYSQYQINKVNCNARDYTRKITDPYDPNVTGVASFFITGLGQIIAGEAGCGLQGQKQCKIED